METHDVVKLNGTCKNVEVVLNYSVGETKALIYQENGGNEVYHQTTLKSHIKIAKTGLKI